MRKSTLFNFITLKALVTAAEKDIGFKNQLLSLKKEDVSNCPEGQLLFEALEIIGSEKKEQYMESINRAIRSFMSNQKLSPVPVVSKGVEQ